MKQLHLKIVYDCRANQTKHPEAPQGRAENLGDDGEGGEAEPSSQSRRRVDRTQGGAATCVVQTQLPGGLGGLEAPQGGAGGQILQVQSAVRRRPEAPIRSRVLLRRLENVL